MRMRERANDRRACQDARMKVFILFPVSELGGVFTSCRVRSSRVISGRRGVPSLGIFILPR